MDITNGVIGLVTQVLEPLRGRQPVLAIGILARFYKCLEQPTSNDRDSNQNVNVPDNVTKVGALWKANSSLAFPLHIMESRPPMVAPPGLPPELPFMFANIQSTCVASGLRPRSSDCFAELLDYDQRHIHQDFPHRRCFLLVAPKYR